MTKSIRNLWLDESAQGATEYILMLVIVVSIAMAFKGKIMEIVSGKTGELNEAIQGFKPEP
jgi:hypothetical protein